MIALGVLWPRLSPLNPVTILFEMFRPIVQCKGCTPRLYHHLYPGL